MEAATPLPFPARVRTLGDELLIESLRVADASVVRLAREREEAGEPLEALVRDAIEIGARVLDRENTAANTDFVKAELEKVGRDLDQAFTERARAVSDHLGTKLDEVFGPETGHVTRALAKHFGDESSVAVQHRVKAVVGEVAAQMREDLRKQFSSDSESNPLAGFQRASLAVMKTSSDQQATHLRAMAEKLEAMKLEIAHLRAEREKLADVAAEAERGTAKGRTYEEAVAEALEALACARGDDAEAVGDVRGEGGRKGDVVVAIDAAAGPARGRIVFEAKNRKLSRNEALAELDGALQARAADYAVLVVPTDEKLPAKTHPLREFSGDKLFVSFDPEDGSTLALEVAYGLARARVLTSRGAASGIDAAQVRGEVERAQGAMEDVRRIKSQLTNARTGIDNAQQIIDAMAGTVRGHLAQIDELLAPAEAGEAASD
jgi:hypothetical protein